jgi:glycosyltransferase involved in cell wall biosynthesis
MRAAMQAADDIDLFVAPSQSIADEFAAAGLDRSRLEVSDYGFPEIGLTRTRGRTRGLTPGQTPGQTHRPRLRIGFVGTLTWHKGAHVLLEAVSRLPPDAYELLIHGDPLVFPEYVSTLRKRAAGLPVSFEGRFDGSAAADIYRALDVLVVPSLWLENSPLVIHEAYQAGVPVVGSRIGGTAQLIEDGRNGRLYDHWSAQDLAAILQSLVDDRSQLDRWSAGLPRVKSIAEDAREWEERYAAVMRGSGPTRA